MIHSSHACRPMFGGSGLKLGTPSQRRGVAVRGFTLLELLAVLLILGIAFTISLPALTTGSATEIKAAARVVAAGLRQAREHAITNHRATVMELDVQRRRIVLGKRSRQLPEQARMALFTARRERIDDTRGAIRFFPDGSSTGGRVTLATGNQSVLVDVDWLTGRVSILEGVPNWEAPTPFEPVRIE